MPEAPEAHPEGPEVHDALQVQRICARTPEAREGPEAYNQSIAEIYTVQSCRASPLGFDITTQGWGVI